MAAKADVFQNAKVDYFFQHQNQFNARAQGVEPTKPCNSQRREFLKLSPDGEWAQAPIIAGIGEG